MICTPFAEHLLPKGIPNPCFLDLITFLIMRGQTLGHDLAEGVKSLSLFGAADLLRKE